MPTLDANSDWFLGFFSPFKDATAYLLGVTVRCYNQWVKPGKVAIPFSYDPRVQPVRSCERFPIDAPPDGLGLIIGEDLVRGINFARRGDEEVAYALAVVAASDNVLQFRTEVDHSKFSPLLRKHYANMLRCMALARNPELEPGRQALTVMREFCRKLFNHLKSEPIAKNHPHYYAWAYVVAMANAYWMTYLGMRYAMDNEDQPVFGRRGRVAEHVLKHAKHVLMQGKNVFTQDKRERVLGRVAEELPEMLHARCFLTFNLMQYAAVAKDIDVFNGCLDQLAEDYPQPHFAAFLIPILKKDDDTGLMLEIEEVEVHISKLLSRFGD